MIIRVGQIVSYRHNGIGCLRAGLVIQIEAVRYNRDRWVTDELSLDHVLGSAIEIRRLSCHVEKIEDEPIVGFDIMQDSSTCEVGGSIERVLEEPQS